MSTGIRSQLAPKGLQFNSSDFFISDKYATILTVVSYPKFIAPGYLSTLTTMPGIKVVIKHIPLPFSMITKMLNKQIAELKTRYQEERDRTIQERIRPSADLRNHYNDISKRCKENKEAVIITVNGRGDTVTISYEEYKNMKARIELLEILSEAEEDVKNGNKPIRSCQTPVKQ